MPEVSQKVMTGRLNDGSRKVAGTQLLGERAPSCEQHRRARPAHGREGTEAPAVEERDGSGGGLRQLQQCQLPPLRGCSHLRASEATALSCRSNRARQTEGAARLLEPKAQRKLAAESSATPNSQHYRRFPRSISAAPAMSRAGLAWAQHPTAASHGCRPPLLRLLQNGSRTALAVGLPAVGRSGWGRNCDPGVPSKAERRRVCERGARASPASEASMPASSPEPRRRQAAQLPLPSSSTTCGPAPQPGAARRSASAARCTRQGSQEVKRRKGHAAAREQPQSSCRVQLRTAFGQRFILDQQLAAAARQVTCCALPAARERPASQGVARTAMPGMPRPESAGSLAGEGPSAAGRS